MTQQQDDNRAKEIAKLAKKARRKAHTAAPPADSSGSATPRTFNYRARSADGTQISETMVATSEAAVAKELLNQGWFPETITAARTKGMNADLAVVFGRRDMRFKVGQVAEFAAELYRLLAAGLTVSNALAIMGEERPQRYTEMCEDLARQVSNGRTLSGALSQYPRAFDEVFIAYIAAGEATGTLVETIERLSTQLNRRHQMALKIKGVTAYPKMVAGVIGLMVTGIMLFLVPVYANLYTDLGQDLPGPTQFMIDLSNALFPLAWWSSDFVPILGGLPIPRWNSPVLWVGLLYLAWRQFARRTANNPVVGENIDRTRYKLPIFGKLVHKTMLFQWCSTAAGALTSGLTYNAMIPLAARASGSRWQVAIADDLAADVAAGLTLSQALGKHPALFPPNVRGLIGTGEASGDPAQMLDAAARTLDGEIDAVIAGLSAKIEVALLLVLGTVVGAMLAVLYLPIINLALALGEGLSGGAF